MNDVTRILNQLSADPTGRSTDELVAHVYDELRQMASAKMLNERQDHSLDATALVHEAYLKLAGSDGGWENRRHFFGAAAEAMRRILIESSRRNGAQKRAGGQAKLELEERHLVDTTDPKWQILSEAIQEFQQKDPAKAELVKLRYFAGLTIKQTAEVLGISTATADRYWAYSRAWLQAYVAEDTVDN